MLNITEDKNYHEGRAIMVLCRVLNFEEARLKHADKPDIQNEIDSVGIEVVYDCYEDEQANTSFVDKYYKTPIADIPPKTLKKFIDRGGTYTVENGLMISSRIGWSTPNNPEHLIDTIKKKVDLLNKGQYKFFTTYRLYVRVDTVSPIFPSYVDWVINDIKKYSESQNYKLSFDTIYLDGWYELLVCDMQKKTYEKYPITRELQNEIHAELKNAGADK